MKYLTITKGQPGYPSVTQLHETYEAAREHAKNSLRWPPVLNVSVFQLELTDLLTKGDTNA